MFVQVLPAAVYTSFLLAFKILLQTTHTHTQIGYCIYTKFMYIHPLRHQGIYLYEHIILYSKMQETSDGRGV